MLVSPRTFMGSERSEAKMRGRSFGGRHFVEVSEARRSGVMSEIWY
jgi:hypothetical protein